MIALLMLAQAPRTPTRGDTGQLLLLIGLAVVVVTLGGLGVMWFRRRVLATPRAAEEHQGFLDQLRAMRDKGEMSEAEYDAARRSMREKLRASLHAIPPQGRPPASG